MNKKKLNAKSLEGEISQETLMQRIQNASRSRPVYNYSRRRFLKYTGAAIVLGGLATAGVFGAREYLRTKPEIDPRPFTYSFEPENIYPLLIGGENDEDLELFIKEFRKNPGRLYSSSDEKRVRQAVSGVQDRFYITI